jgi:hypothetical protein
MSEMLMNDGLIPLAMVVSQHQPPMTVLSARRHFRKRRICSGMRKKLNISLTDASAGLCSPDSMFSTDTSKASARMIPSILANTANFTVAPMDFDAWIT